MAEANESISVEAQDGVLVLVIELESIAQYEVAQSLGNELLEAVDQHSSRKVKKPADLHRPIPAIYYRHFQN